ncbi:MAG: ABC transporter ATP-binding protein [Legionellaceae bacterium]|nr:ABC transporter ATP-binding protein [Legionellaceae bacterium]
MHIQELSLAILSTKHCLPVIEDINFELLPGNSLVILGESGSGKSLTATALTRLLPPSIAYSRQSKIELDMPAQYMADGDLTYNNDKNVSCTTIRDSTKRTEDILTLPEYLMRQVRGKKIAMIFQEPMSALHPVLTIKEQLQEALLTHQNLSKKELNAACILALQEVEISDPALRLKQYPHQLSGGQKQRILIAIALASQPEILIADEPTTALDVTIQNQVLCLIQKIQKKRNMSLLLITHDFNVARLMADHIAVLYAGHLMEYSDTQAFFHHIIHPYTQQLSASLPSPDIRENLLPVIPGAPPSFHKLPSGCRFHPRCIYAMDRCRQEVPALRVVENNRSIRCHLDWPNLPDLPETSKIPTNIVDKNTNPILHIENLCIDFQMPRHSLRETAEINHAVDHVSFKLYKNEIVALVGESGCGKTTLSRAILGLQAISSGKVYFYDKNIQEMSRQERLAAKIQIVFQDPVAALNPRLTIQDTLLEALQHQSISKSEKQLKMSQLLEEVGLSAEIIHRFPHQFSGGQRQRINIARALATDPELIICDEPTSALDSSVQAQILNLLKQRQREKKLSYLLITHNMAVVSYLADRVLIMRQGRIIEEGTWDNIQNNPQTAYTRKLLESAALSKQVQENY